MLGYVGYVRMFTSDLSVVLWLSESAYHQVDIYNLIKIIFTYHLIYL